MKTLDTLNTKTNDRFTLDKLIKVLKVSSNSTFYSKVNKLRNKLSEIKNLNFGNLPDKAIFDNIVYDNTASRWFFLMDYHKMIDQVTRDETVFKLLSYIYNAQPKETHKDITDDIPF